MNSLAKQRLWKTSRILILLTQKYKKVLWEPDRSGFSLALGFKMLEGRTFTQVGGSHRRAMRVCGELNLLGSHSCHHRKFLPADISIFYHTT